MFTLMSSNKKKLMRNLASINAAAGCGCGKPKLTDAVQPKPKSKTNKTCTSSSSSSAHQTTLLPISSSTPRSSWDRNGGISDEADYTSTTFSLSNFDTYSPRQSDADTSITTNVKSDDRSKSCYNMISQCPKIGNSVAVVKDSSDPYQDFRKSMLQMILEKEIFSLDDLQELLSCFLELNSPSQHDVIVEAFLDILNNNDDNSNEFFFSCNNSSSSPSSPSSTTDILSIQTLNSLVEKRGKITSAVKVHTGFPLM